MEVSNEQILGNQAEAFVSFKLSQYCLVRPVASGTDIGIDLYCESLIDNNPQLHFWIQVKSSSKIEKSMDDNIISYSFEVKHLKYWKTQPVPVFVFFVHEANLINPQNFRLYVFNITEQLISGIYLEGKTKTLQSNLIIQSDYDLKNFIYNTIEITSSRQKFEDGIIAPTHSTKNKYVKRLFPQGSSKYADNIFQTLRGTAAFILGDLIDRELIDPTNEKIIKNRKEFTAVLEAFKERKNWEVPYNLGRAYFQEGRNKEAIEQLHRSINIIKGDNEIVQEEWQINIQIMEDLIQKINNNNT